MRWIKGICIGIGLLTLARPVAADTPAESCDCSCPTYQAQFRAADPAGAVQQELARCGPACAIAWERCERGVAQNERSDEDHQTIAALLDRFLSGASIGDRSVHDQFWSEELVYTSSSGHRFGKPELMAGLEPTAASGQPGPSYSAHDVRIRPFGDLALLNFTLVAEGDEQPRLAFFNSGVLRRERDQWRVINWQATRKAEPGKH